MFFKKKHKRLKISQDPILPFQLSIFDERRRPLMETSIDKKQFLFSIKRYRACFFDSTGSHIRTVSFSRNDRTFSFKDGVYNIVLDGGSHTLRKTIFHDYYTYYYNLNNPMPLTFKETVSPVINANDYKQVIDTKIIRDLNNLSNDWLKNLLTPRNIFIGIVIIIAIIYFTSGGNLDGLTK